jgi:hypothetical protein
VLVVLQREASCRLRMSILTLGGSQADVGLVAGAAQSPQDHTGKILCDLTSKLSLVVWTRRWRVVRLLMLC